MGDERTGDGGGKEFERVLDALRTRLTDGTYQVGNRLPPQRELAEELTSESLDTYIRVQADRIRSREIAPQSIAVRMLLPSEQLELPYPRAKNNPADTRPQERLQSIADRSTASLRYVLQTLRVENLVPDVRLEIRHAPLTPAFKLYLLNGTGALFGPYKVTERPIFLDSDEEVMAIDVVGLGADLTHYVKDDDPDSPGTFFVNSMQEWFNSVWKHLPEPSPQASGQQ
ncbi:GntR family transcriptional regulator [Streptomyces yerevanensis]|uniref:GntR family transcriptional regulator n=1 Tax=Streptomyces yerevanensis TaxID=66378 RepID=UPI0005269D71|nr:GntR family transcriptional regulator [Streptomyces yerevanensis]